MNYKTLTALAGIGAMIAATTVSIGATLGLHSITDNWFIAAPFGIGLGLVIGILWHMTIQSAASARRGLNRWALVIIGMVLVGIAISTSSWSLATAIGGKQALQGVHVEAIQTHADALYAAHNRVRQQSALIDVTGQVATAYAGASESEASGGLSGRAGFGPKAQKYALVADSFRGAASDMQGTLDEAQTTYKAGQAQLNDARRAMSTGDKMAVSNALNAVQSTISDLNAVDITGNVANTGIVNFTTGTKGVSQVADDELTSKVQQTAASIDTTPIPVPVFVPTSQATAIVDRAGDVPLAWIMAISFDFLPFALLVLVLLLWNEPLMREAAMPKRTSDDEIRTREENVVGFAPRGAAE